MSEYNVVDNTELVELIEQGLRKGYWDKALIPELKKRFKELEKQEKLLSKIKEIIDRQDDDSYISSMLEESQKYYEIKKLMNKEKENE